MKRHRSAYTGRFISEAKKRKIDVINRTINNVKTNLEDDNYCKQFSLLIKETVTILSEQTSLRKPNVTANKRIIENLSKYL